MVLLNVCSWRPAKSANGRFPKRDRQQRVDNGLYRISVANARGNVCSRENDLAEVGQVQTATSPAKIADRDSRVLG